MDFILAILNQWPIIVLSIGVLLVASSVIGRHRPLSRADRMLMGMRKRHEGGRRKSPPSATTPRGGHDGRGVQGMLGVNPVENKMAHTREDCQAIWERAEKKREESDAL